MPGSCGQQKAKHTDEDGVLRCHCSYSVFLFTYLPGQLPLPFAGCAVLTYFLWLEQVVDYEYVYVDKEIRVAKIYQKQKRKDLAVYDLSKMEMMAPQGSHHLDAYKNRDLKVIDYSSGDDSNKSCRYELIMEGGSRLILDMVGEYGEQIVALIRNYYPRIVFTS